MEDLFKKEDLLSLEASTNTFEFCDGIKEKEKKLYNRSLIL